MTVIEKYKILGQYIKDSSSETPNIETYLFVREIISNYKLGIDITSKALKNKMIEITTKLIFQDKEDSKKKSYFEMNYSTIIQLTEGISDKKELEKIVDEHGMGDNVNVAIDSKGVKVEFSNFSLYDSGSAAIKPGAVPMLGEVTKVIRDTAAETHLVEVEGHTDDVPISNERFPSNWELSSARASNVVKYLLGKGIGKERLKASGYADSRPKQAVSEGQSYTPEQRAANRRVVIYIKRY